MIDTILKLARGEIGTVEFPPNSNKVKYNTAYYREVVSGPRYAWCAAFIWWLFHEAGCPELYYDGDKCAWVPELVAWAKRKGLLVKEPKAGDLICFDFNGNGQADHIGLCTGANNKLVHTIDGNTGVGNEANGGAVMARSRDRTYIAAVIRPRYEEVETMTDEKFDEMMGRWLAKQAGKKPTAPWQKEGLARAKAAGVTDGSNPMGLCTRLEAAIMAANAKK